MREYEPRERSIDRRKCIAEEALLGRLWIFDISIPQKEEITPFFDPGFVRGGKSAFFGCQMSIDVRDFFVLLQILITEGGVADGLVADGDVRDFARRSAWSQPLSIRRAPERTHFSNVIVCPRHSQDAFQFCGKRRLPLENRLALIPDQKESHQGLQTDGL